MSGLKVNIPEILLGELAAALDAGDRFDALTLLPAGQHPLGVHRRGAQLPGGHQEGGIAVGAALQVRGPVSSPIRHLPLQRLDDRALDLGQAPVHPGPGRLGVASAAEDAGQPVDVVPAL